ncbi:hypothetical protein QP157_00215 [Sphingomonas sp. LR61]|uniref:hypothetical protein n=1 Tax=Sphingomonas sp. LR61 TaxID=3050234 RepID=UPI002FDF246B
MSRLSAPFRNEVSLVAAEPDELALESPLFSCLMSVGATSSTTFSRCALSE